MRVPTGTLRVVDCLELPTDPSSTTVYRLLPRDPDDAYYRERTDRNIGWITPAEQEILRSSVIGIAGCGGMGGILASQFVRLGVGEVRIADCEEFDVSNINRQFGAMRSTVGESKAFTTARLTRQVTDDATLVVYPQGITEETVDPFVEGCSVVLDEIEFNALAPRILLHERGRAAGTSLFNCNTIGISTNLFLYTPESMTMEEATGFTYPEAKRIQSKADAGDTEARWEISRAVARAVIPELPEYCPDEPETNRAAFARRLLNEGRVSILGVNPLMAAGFLADRVTLHLLRHSGIRRNIADTPPMPGYLHMDAAKMLAVVNTDGRWLDDAVAPF